MQFVNNLLIYLFLNYLIFLINLSNCSAIVDALRAGHTALMKHVEFVWFHYDFLLRCGENRHRNLTAALYDRPSSDSGPLGRQELPPSFSPSLAVNQVKTNTH